jgi:hypothetical protein
VEVGKSLIESPAHRPPISLPKREFMERAKVIWEELGLPIHRSERIEETLR